MLESDPETLRRDLARIVGDRRVSVRHAELESYSRDMWPRLLFAVQGGALPAHRPHAVVWPTSEQEVAAVVAFAAEHRIPIVPYGGGSGVCGGAVPIRGGITIDLKRLDEIRSLSREEMVCDVEAGINGERFERELSRRGYTLGHFPSSIYCSTVGGWLACRAAGQMSTKYGKIEDRVAGLTVVTGTGKIIHTDELARASRGPNWTQLVVGSEGTLGVITAARLRVAVAPALRLLRGYEFDDVGAGVEAIRRVMQRGLRPAVVRLYDEVDTLIHSINLFKGVSQPGEDRRRFAPTPAPGAGALPAMPAAADEPATGALDHVTGWLRSARRGGLASRLRRELVTAALHRPRLVGSLLDGVSERISRSGCRMIVGVEGSRIRTEVEARLTFTEIERAGGRDLGEEPGLDWFEHRYSVSYGMSRVFRQGAFVDTMEVASTWDKLMDLYRAVREAIGEHALVMAHFSHAYPDGCSIYFTFAGHGEDRAESERIYDAIWSAGMRATTRAGGTISHHHGIGLLKAPHMAAEHREGMRLFGAIKSTLDPHGILNPGKLGLEER
jgi:alkyldihydroxyacetonephosphate synthase